jgi:hypothetical protein
VHRQASEASTVSRLIECKDRRFTLRHTTEQPKREDHPDWRKSSGIPVPKPEDFGRARYFLERTCPEQVPEMEKAA